MNATKTILAGALNGIAVVLFVVAGKVSWPQTLVMLVAAVCGGYLAARAARRVPQKQVRVVVLVISVCMTIAFFVRHYG
jgi:uncharacterized membrane protein YfcA